MSNSTAINNHLLVLADIALAETDPLRRLKAARQAEQGSRKTFRRIVRKAAYDARMIFSAQDIQDITGIDRKDIDYLVKAYLQDNPMDPKPKQRKHVDLSEYMDLTGEK